MRIERTCCVNRQTFYAGKCLLGRAFLLCVLCEDRRNSAKGLTYLPVTLSGRWANLCL